MKQKKKIETGSLMMDGLNSNYYLQNDGDVGLEIVVGVDVAVGLWHLRNVLNGGHDYFGH